MDIRLFCVRNLREYLRRIDNIDYVDEAITNEHYLMLTTAMNQRYPNYFDACQNEICGKTNIFGLNLDFNFGLRLDVPEGNFHVTVSEFDTGQIFFDEDISNVRLMSFEKYFIHWHVEVSLDGKKVFTHTFDPTGRDVRMVFRAAAMGDTIALMPQVRAFKEKYHCNVTVAVPEYMREFVARLYPDIPQTSVITYRDYATFYLVIGVIEILEYPADGKNVPMENMGGIALGLHEKLMKAKFFPTAPRKISEPYVCIGVQASGVNKSWLYKNGWDTVVAHLKNLGYRVLCIDKDKKCEAMNYSVEIPQGAEDFTGDIPIIERANMLYYADFFIGLGSGLSWLADAVGCKVILICGFTQSWCEFYTPYRVANRFVCNGCFNDIRVEFTRNFCPYHAGTPREMECQKKISPAQVIDTIDRLIADKNFSEM